MYDVQRVINALFGRVGWKQPTQPEYAILTEPNTLSKSGRYFTDAHNAVSVQNIKENQDDPNISDPDFNLMLEQMQKTAILRVLSDIFNLTAVVDCLQVFDRESDEANDEFIENTGKFVGVKVTLGRAPDYAVALSSVVLYFDSDVEFELKCFIENKATPIWTKTVKATANEATIVDVSDLVLSYMSGVARTTAFYIGYFQNDIGEAKAHNEEMEALNAGFIWKAEFVKTGISNGNIILPIEDFTDDTYGLNLQFTTYRDYTNIIVPQPQIFDNAVSLQFACNVLELILSGSRSNKTQRISSEQLGDMFVALNQEMPTDQSPVGPGLKVRYRTEIEKLQKAIFAVPKIETHSLPYAVYSDRDDRR